MEAGKATFPMPSNGSWESKALRLSGEAKWTILFLPAPKRGCPWAMLK